MLWLMDGGDGEEERSADGLGSVSAGLLPAHCNSIKNGFLIHGTLQTDMHTGLQTTDATLRSFLYQNSFPGIILSIAVKGE